MANRFPNVGTFTHNDLWAENVPFSVCVGTTLREICLTINEIEVQLGRGDAETAGTLWRYMIHEHPDNGWIGDDPVGPLSAQFTKWPLENSGTVAAPVWENEVTFPEAGDFDVLGLGQSAVVEIIKRARAFFLALLTNSAWPSGGATDFHGWFFDAAALWEWHTGILDIDVLVLEDSGPSSGRYIKMSEWTWAERFDHCGRAGQTAPFEDDLGVEFVGMHKGRLTEAIDELLDLLKLFRYWVVNLDVYQPSSQAAGTGSGHYPNANVLRYQKRQDPDEDIVGAFGCADHLHASNWPDPEEAPHQANAAACWTHQLADAWQAETTASGETADRLATRLGVVLHRITPTCAIVDMEYGFYCLTRREVLKEGVNPLTEWSPMGTILQRALRLQLLGFTGSAPIDFQVGSTLIELSTLTERASVDTVLTDWPVAGDFIEPTNFPASSPYSNWDHSGTVGSDIVIPRSGGYRPIAGEPFVPVGYLDSEDPSGFFQIMDLGGLFSHI